jgi:TPR repeat protein
MFFLLKRWRAAPRSSAGIALIDLLVFIVAGIFAYGIVMALLHYSPVVRNPYPPAVGQSYPEDSRPTAKQRQWALATSAVLTEANNYCHFILEETQLKNGRGAKIMREGWGIRNRADLLRTLKRLEEGGHRKNYDEYVHALQERGELEPPSDTRYAADLCALDDSEERTLAVVKIIHKRFGTKGLAGWDFSRYVSLCRWGAHAGYLTEEEAWKKIMPVARLIQSTFSSWEELGYNYRLGRIFWAPMHEEDYILVALRKLRNKTTSPWVALPWNVNLLPEKQQDDGSAEALRARALAEGFGNGCDQETCKAYWVEAFNLYHTSAEKGDICGMYFLANCYNQGWGCAPDQKLYREWIEKCIAAGEPWAHYRLAFNGYCSKELKIDKKRVAELLAFSVTNNGPVASVAMLGWVYETGYGGTKKDLKKALDIYTQAASTEDAWAMSQIGDLYQAGLGVDKNPIEAAHWYRRSAINGGDQGMYKYAECLRKGSGVPTNTVEALIWYHQAATNNESRAIKYLKSLQAK